MRVLLAVLLLSGLTAFAQGRNKPVFDVPEEKESKPETPETRDSLDATIRRLGSWPSDTARRAAELLIVQKERSLPVVLETLVSQRPEDDELKPGAAYVLGRVGERTHVMTLLHVASEKEQHRFASVFLEAAARIDNDLAVAEAFRFFRLAATTLRAQAVKFVRARVTKENLDKIEQLLDPRDAERPFTREIGLILLDRLVQTKELTWAEASPRIYRALGDASPQVASRAMRLAASHDDTANITALNDLITSETSYWRQRSYAALALSILSSAYKVQPLREDTLAQLKGVRGLQHPKEMLVQASAALALAQAALRSRDRELVKLLDRKIPVILIEAVGAGNRHYRDFASVMPLAYTMLRRITGETIPDQAPLWARWWLDNGARFRARRELIEVEKEDLPFVTVDVTWPSADAERSARFATVGPQRPTYLHGRAYAVPHERMEAFLAHIRQAGLFETPESDPTKIGADESLVVVRVGDLVRTVAFGAAKEEQARVRAGLLKAADTLAGDFAWQLWWDTDAKGSWEIFFAENHKWFAAHPDPQERADRNRALVAAALNNITDADDRLHATRFVAGLPGGGGALSPEEVDAFLKVVDVEIETNEFVAAAVELLVPEAGEKAARGLVDALARKIGPSAQGLLVHVLSSFADEELALYTTDPRWKVRVASVRAAGAREGDDVAAVLVPRLQDDEVLVRVAAAEALAARKDQRVLPALASLAAARSPEVRRAAAYAYGLLAGERGRELVTPLLYEDPSAEVRVRAIEGLVESGDPKAADLLVEVFKNEADVRVRASAAAGIVDLERPELVQRLVQRLEITESASPERVALVNVLARFRSREVLPILQAVLNGDDTLSADAAALGLARRWDDAAISQLVRMVRSGRNALSAVRHLQILSSQSFEGDRYQNIGDNYAAWYQANATGNPRFWYREALVIRGYRGNLLNPILDDLRAEPVVPDEAVPVLLRALRDKEWFIVRNASFLLSLKMGEGAPEPITYTTRPSEAEAAIRAYNDWWRETEAEKEAERRG